MKRAQAVIANTLLDSQGERLSKDALNQLVASIEKSYVPVGIEHDPRIPPQGRIVSGHVRERSDGELEAVATIEFFDHDESVKASEINSEKEIVLSRPPERGMIISYDWTHRSELDQADIAAIAAVFETDPCYDIKKSQDPISLITIAGAFALGGIATGFLGQIGVDGWNFIKSNLEKIFKRKELEKIEWLLSFNIYLKNKNSIIEVEVILTRPSVEDIDQFLKEGLPVVEKILPFYLENSEDIRRIVFETKGKDLELRFAVRKDCVPLNPSVSVKDLLKKI